MANIVRSYQDLEVWRKAMTLAKSIYQATSRFPTEEKFGLVNQMRRAAVSVPSNLAEGHARTSINEFKHFVSVALGSTAELETQILLSAELGYLKDSEKEQLLDEIGIVGRMRQGLRKSLKAKSL